jgi:hypothetical protein
MAYEKSHDDLKPTQILMECIQERRQSASTNPRSRGGGSGSGNRSGIKDIPGLKAKADARQDVYDLLTSMKKECKLTMPQVDVAIPDGRIAIKVIGKDDYAANDQYQAGVVRSCLGWSDLHTRQLKAMRWLPVLIDADAYKRIATTAKREDFLCRILKMGKYEIKKEDENSRKGSRKKKNRNKKK